MELDILLKGVKVEGILAEGMDLKSLDIKGIACDSSKVSQDFLFFCIDGFKTNGHFYANDAKVNGAKALILQRDVETKGIVKIFVKDSREAMAIISSNFYNSPSSYIDIVGITGTNGKTTSSFIMKSILEKHGLKCGLIGTIYNIYSKNADESIRTTPESNDLQRMLKSMVDNEFKACAMEVSSHSLYLKRVFKIPFKAGIFTNLSQDHLDFHGNMENYFYAKLKLFDNCDYAIINCDDDYGKRALKIIKGNVITFGLGKDAELRAENIKIIGGMPEFDLIYKNKCLKIKMNLLGKYNVYNALGAASAAIAMDIPLETIKNGIEGLLGILGRNEKIYSKKGFTVIIDYAHTPDGLDNILRSVKENAKNKVITVFGCGGDRDKTKRSIMGNIVGNLSDYCIVTNDNPRSEEPKSIINEILEGLKITNCIYEVIEDRRCAIERAIKLANEGDAVLIAGKGHEKYQVLKDKTIPFDERQIVGELLKED